MSAFFLSSFFLHMYSNDDETQYIISFIYEKKKKNTEFREVQKQITKLNGIRTKREDWRNKRGFCKWFIKHKAFTFPYLKKLENETFQHNDIQNDQIDVTKQNSQDNNDKTSQNEQEKHHDVEIIGNIFNKWIEDPITNHDDEEELNSIGFFSSSSENDLDQIDFD